MSASSRFEFLLTMAQSMNLSGNKAVQFAREQVQSEVEFEEKNSAIRLNEEKQKAEIAKQKRNG